MHYSLLVFKNVLIHVNANKDVDMTDCVTFRLFSLSLLFFIFLFLRTAPPCPGILDGDSASHIRQNKAKTTVQSLKKRVIIF